MGDYVNRDLSGRPQIDTPVKKGRNVVAVIGIDQYRHNQILSNAVSDARGVRELFTNQLDYVEIVPALFDENATGAEITRFVRDELNDRLEEDDSLVLFFSGHGYTETRRVGSREVKIGYLIPVDGLNPQAEKYSTFIKIASFLEDVANLPARHVLVILDACDSGFALGGAARKDRGAARYQDEMSRKMSRKVITSAMDQQPALDGGPVPGHSLFTGTLIEAVAMGKADEGRKGFITGRELGLFLQQNVAMHSISKQTPDFGEFELDDGGDLVISLLGETHNRQLAMEALQAGRHGLAIGQFTNDKRRYLFSASQFQQAVRQAQLGKLALPEAELGLGEALLMAGELPEAVRVLEDLVSRDKQEHATDASFWLGLAYARQKMLELAEREFRSWLGNNPDHRDAGWVSQYVDWLSDRQDQIAGRFHALLIGINDYQAKNLVPLQGCVNDVKNLIMPILEKRFNLKKKDCKLLTDQFATRRRISDAFGRLSKNAGYSDTVLVYFSGHSIPTEDPLYPGFNDADPYLLVYDTKEEQGRYSNVFSARELHELMKAIPAVNKTLVLDTHASRVMIDFAELEGDYNLVLASDTSETAYEWSVNVDGEDLKCGMMSGALYTLLQSAVDLKTYTYRQWINDAIQITQAASYAANFPGLQTPLFIGEGGQTVFGGTDPFLTAFELSYRKSWDELTVQQLHRRYQQFDGIYEIKSPRLYEAFGVAFRKKGYFQFSLDALLAGLEHFPEGYPGLVRELATTRLLGGLTDAAREDWIIYNGLCQKDEQDLLQSLSTKLNNLVEAHPKVKVLLVNVSRKELEEQVPEDVNPAFEEVTTGRYSMAIDHLRAVLEIQFGKETFDLEVYTREDILSAQDEITGLGKLFSPDQPALVCIFGLTDVSPVSTGLPGNFIQDLKQAAEGKPVFLWIQRDPRKVQSPW